MEKILMPIMVVAFVLAMASSNFAQGGGQQQQWCRCECPSPPVQCQPSESTTASSPAESTTPPSAEETTSSVAETSPAAEETTSQAAPSTPSGASTPTASTPKASTAKPNQTCPPDEQVYACPAASQPRCSQPEPVCPLTCPPPSCQCKPGFVRNDRGKCVRKDKCPGPKPKPPPCCNRKHCVVCKPPQRCCYRPGNKKERFCTAVFPPFTKARPYPKHRPEDDDSEEKRRS